MSRVRADEKYMNTNHYDSSVTGPSKIRRSKMEDVDYTKARTLTSWLFLKYDMSYKTFRRKSAGRREELKKEYETDTGNRIPERNASCIEDEAADILISKN